MVEDTLAAFNLFYQISRHLTCRLWSSGVDSIPPIMKGMMPRMRIPWNVGWT